MARSYFSPKIEVRESSIGRGLFAVQPILKHEVMIDFAKESRVFMGEKEAARHEAGGNHYIIQVDERLYAARLDEPEKGDFINHSCEPNCGIDGSLRIIAMRDIAPGEEITFDYAMTESYYFYRLDCLCSTPSCRRAVTGSDWKRKDLQQKYEGYFSAYIGKKIKRSAFQRIVSEIGERAQRRAQFYGKRIRRLLALPS